MERTKFKAFQPVLVRNGSNAHWKTALYSNYNAKLGKHFCDNQPWDQVIPYTEHNEYLIGTTQASLEEVVNTILPEATPEEMAAAFAELVEKSNKECEQLAKTDPIHVRQQLEKDVADWGLQYEFEEFVKNNPELDIIELDRQFRKEWDV